MTRCRTLVVSLLLVHSALAQFESNMFLNGEYRRNLNAYHQQQQYVKPSDLNNNLYVDHAINSRQAIFEGPTYLPPKCEANDVCVPSNECQNGYFSSSFYAQSSRRDCDANSEVCCTYNAPPPPPETPCTDESYDCVAPYNCRNGEISISGYSQKKSYTCTNQDVCCRIPAATILTDDGYILRIPDKPLEIPTRPPTQTLAPQYIPPRPFSTRPPYVAPQTTRRPYVAPETTRRPYVAPETTRRPYVAPETTRRPYIAPQTTRRPYVAPETTRRPYVAPETTRRPVYTTQAPQYLPPHPSHDGQSSNENPNRVNPPTTKKSVYSDYLSEPITTTKAPRPITPQREKPRPRPRPNTDQLSEPINMVPSSCASALVCTEDQFCNALGVISKTPVTLTKNQELFRVPTTNCRLPGNSAIGKCCRDPDYVDPWPTIRTGPICGTRSTGGSLKGPSSIDADFAEYPWQAMVLLGSTKSLLCGGAIIGPKMVLTSASCVKDRKVNDVLIKAGEWKLGSDEEPLDFIIKNAVKIDIHPRFDSLNLQNDLAIISLDSDLSFKDKHIKPICLSDRDPDTREDCRTFGWGKDALRVNLQDAIMHHSKVTPLSKSDCNAPDNSVCGSTEIDGCDLDYGSALACGDGKNYVLKGIYTKENQCGQSIVTFTKPDLEWIQNIMGRTTRRRRLSF